MSSSFLTVIFVAAVLFGVYLLFGQLYPEAPLVVAP